MYYFSYRNNTYWRSITASIPIETFLPLEVAIAPLEGKIDCLFAAVRRRRSGYVTPDQENCAQRGIWK